MTTRKLAAVAYFACAVAGCFDSEGDGELSGYVKACHAAVLAHYSGVDYLESAGLGARVVVLRSDEVDLVEVRFLALPEKRIEDPTLMHFEHSQNSICWLDREDLAISYLDVPDPVRLHRIPLIANPGPDDLALLERIERAKFTKYKLVRHDNGWKEETW